MAKKAKKSSGAAAKAKEAIKKARAAEKEAKAAEKTAAKEEAKEKAAKEKAKNLKKAQKELDPAAKEINVRLEKAAQNDSKADDHRLAAAIKLDEVKTRCNDLGLKFKEWCEGHLDEKWSYENARKLARIGAADDPQLALEDLRSGSRKAMEKKRKKDKEEGKKAAVKPAPKVAEEAFDNMSKEDAVKVLKKANKKHKLGLGKGSADKGLDGAIAAFEDLDAKDKMRLMAHMAGKMDATVTIFDEDIHKAVKGLK